MKICMKCKSTFDDSAAFCPLCGEKLAAYQMDQHNQNSQKEPGQSSTKGKTGVGRIFSNIKESAKNTSVTWDEHSNIFMRWMASILAVAGLLAEWNISVRAGAVIAVCSACIGWYSKKTLNKIISAIAGILAVLIFVVYLFCL
ncbi:MAG: hypothetical protein HFH59_02935 [Lachnospiraceae bacterium]|nr:hypothetical protein [Lachnospiraceae bacterium]MCI9356498.1 hypothetical protein [Lachnospiraceae bacterium]